MKLLYHFIVKVFLKHKFLFRTSTTGFAGRANLDDEIEESTIIMKKNSSVGVAIAPPPSLQDSSSSILNSSGIGVAQKIMAKYGFKEGSGLGRKEQV